MNRHLLRWSVRLGLLEVLSGLLVYARLTDRPSPAYPHGQFGELVGSALVLVVLVAAVLAAPTCHLYT